MTAIANVALSNTFDYWRIRTNEAINFINTEAANTGWAVSNTVFQSTLANTNSYIATKVSTVTFNSALANTNSYIATKVNTSTFNSALANTNAYIATKVNTSTFNSALANTNVAISDRLQVANAEAKFVSNTYASNTFSSYDAIVITTPAANTEYEFLRALPRNQDYREIYYSTQFGSANVGFWVGGNLVANVSVSSTANTNNISVTGKKGDRVYIHLYDAAISSTANLEFSFGG